VVWDCVKADRDGEILIEVNDAVRETLIASMDARNSSIGREPRTDEIGPLRTTCRPDVVDEVREGLTNEERAQLAPPCPTRRVRSAADGNFELITIPRGRDASSRAALPASLR